MFEWIGNGFLTDPQAAAALEVSFVLLTGFVAATLVPVVHRSVPRSLEVLAWIALIGVAIMTIRNISDQEVRQATESIEWGAMQVAGTQLSLLTAAATEWLAASRFEIALWVAIGGGVDVLALALVRSHRGAREAAARVHLGEWFELTAQPVPAPAPDAVAALDRALDRRIRLGAHALAHSPVTRAVIVRPYAHLATRLLAPGPARLAMVKLALGIERRKQDEPAPAAPPRLVLVQAAPRAWTRPRRRYEHRHARGRHGRPERVGGVKAAEERHEAAQAHGRLAS